MYEDHVCAMSLTHTELVLCVSNDMLVNMGFDRGDKFTAPFMERDSFDRPYVKIRKHVRGKKSPTFCSMPANDDWSRIRFQRDPKKASDKDRYKVIDYIRDQVGSFGLSYMDAGSVWLDAEGQICMRIPEHKPDVRHSVGGKGRAPTLENQEQNMTEETQEEDLSFLDDNETERKTIVFDLSINMKPQGKETGYSVLVIENATGHVKGYHTEDEAAMLRERYNMAKSSSFESIS